MTARNSDYIAQFATTPATMPDSHLCGLVREIIGVVTPAADEADDSIHRFLRVPTNARITDLLIAAADATLAGKYDFGLYYPTGVNDGAVIDRDLLSAAFDLSVGPFYWSSVMAVGTTSIANSVKPLWELAGLSSDPGGHFDIVGTVETPFNGGPTSVGLKARFVV